MSGFVVDASMVLAWFFVDEASEAINAVRARTDTEMLHVPRHWFARAHRLTIYDAAYLDLALRRGLPLATLDSTLAAAARAAGVAVIDL